MSVCQFWCVRPYGALPVSTSRREGFKFRIVELLFGINLLVYVQIIWLVASFKLETSVSESR